MSASERDKDIHTLRQLAKAKSALIPVPCPAECVDEIMRSPEYMALQREFDRLFAKYGFNPGIFNDHERAGSKRDVTRKIKDAFRRSDKRSEKQRARKAILRSSLLALLSVAAFAQASEPDRRIALTIDDLPWQRLGERAEADLAAQHANLIAALKQANVPVIGFVNEAKLEVDGKIQPARVQMLRDWREAGFALGNHTFGHVDLHAVGLAAYEQDILRGEATLRPLLAETGQTPQWFRHPYLRAGQSPEVRAALGTFLQQHGYQVAPVTIDNSEWIWAFAYDRVRDTETDPVTRDARLRQLRRGYVPYMLNKLDYYEQRSQQLLGRLPAQVWLIHANALNADSVEELVAATRRRGYHFITLDEALQDPAYQHADGYNGGGGISWIQRWAMAEKVPKTFYADEPMVPGWVMTLEGRAGE